MREMSVRRTKTTSEEVQISSETKKKFRLPKWAMALVIAVAALGLYWYKTNSWPVVAVVGYRPITRFEVNKSLFAKNGKAEVENMITEMQVQAELRSLGINIPDSEVDAKVNEISKSLGEGNDIETILASRGMTLGDYKRQLKLLMGAEKAVSKDITVSSEEVTNYLQMSGGSATDSAAVASASESVRLSKLDQEINKWVMGLSEKQKVWKMPGL